MKATITCDNENTQRVIEYLLAIGSRRTTDSSDLEFHGIDCTDPHLDVVFNIGQTKIGIDVTVSESKPKKKKMTFRDAMARAGKWFRELKSEFKKVVWPTKKQVLKNTAVVLVVLVIVGVLVGLLDFAFEKLILEQLLKLATGY